MVVCAFFALQGCAKTKSLSFNLSADSKINLNDKGESSPLVVSLYALKDKDIFLKSNFQSLYNHAQITLGDQLIKVKSVELIPNTKIKFTWVVPLKTNYIGVVAAYRELAKSEWRTVFKLNKGYKEMLLKQDRVMHLSFSSR